MELNKLDYYLIATIVFDIAIIVTVLIQAIVLKQFPPAGFWTFCAVCLGGEKLVSGMIKIAQDRAGVKGND